MSKAMNYSIRLIEPGDDHEIKRIILKIREEFDVVNMQEGQSTPELDNVSTYYRNQYFVIVDENAKLYGGGGFRTEDGIAHIEKFYFLPEIRKFGFATKILERCLNKAFKELNCTEALSFTADNMVDSIAVHKKFGFEQYKDPSSKANAVSFRLSKQKWVSPFPQPPADKLKISCKL